MLPTHPHPLASVVTDPPYPLIIDQTSRPPPGWAAGLALACGLLASASCCSAVQSPAVVPALLLASFAGFVLVVGPGASAGPVSALTTTWAPVRLKHV